MLKVIILIILLKIIFSYLIFKPLNNEQNVIQFDKQFKKALIYFITCIIIVLILITFNVIIFNTNILIYIFFMSIIYYIFDFIESSINSRIRNGGNRSYDVLKLTGTYIFRLLGFIFTAFLIGTIMLTNLEIISLLDYRNLKEGILIIFEEKVLISMLLIVLNAIYAGNIIGIQLRNFKFSNEIEETTIESTLTTDDSNLSVEDFREGFEKNRVVSSLQNIRGQLQLNKKITIIRDSSEKSGFWIGVLERNLILILAFSDNLASIGFLIAMKAITRFKQFEDKSFSEYYLIGTMISITIGILSGYLLKLLWSL